MIDPILQYPGAKWRLAPWIVSHFPAHSIYVEPFAGSGAVFFHKPPAPLEVLNDLSGDVVNFFRVLRDRPQELIAQVELTPWARAEYDLSWQPTADPLEQARRFVVRCWQAHSGRLDKPAGWRHAGNETDAGKAPSPTWRKLPDRLWAVADRMRQAEIECRPALEIIERYCRPDVLLYVDPPYLASTRHRELYAHEMMDPAAHTALLTVLQAHPGPVVLSGYRSVLYDATLPTWRRVDMASQRNGAKAGQESLWLNAAAARRVQLRLFEVPA